MRRAPLRNAAGPRDPGSAEPVRENVYANSRGALPGRRLSVEEKEESGVSRRRFLSLLALSAAGAMAAASLPAAGEAALSELAGGKADPVKDEADPAEAARWEARRRTMLRAHEDAVLHTREEG